MKTRASFYEDVEKAIAAAEHGPLAALMILRITNYRELAVALGYASLERIERAIVSLMQASLRPIDVVTHIGDGAFAAVLPQLKAANAAGLAAIRLTTALEKPIAVDERTVVVGVAVGIAIIPEHGRDADTLCRHAERACLDAPKQPERFQIYQPDADALAFTDADLRTAMRASKLDLALQPIRSFANNELVGAEALARWKHDEDWIAPMRFIPLAEQAGLIDALTHWSLNATLRHAARVRATGKDLFFALNVSPRVFRQRDFVEQAVGALRIWNVPPTSLVAELTETAIMDDPSQSARVLRRLRDHGIRIAIDDFGTGYSSFSYLRQLPATELKIDMSFVSSLANDPRAAQIVRSMIVVAHHLDMTVIAEGVEDAQTHALLQDMGCDLAQGFYIGRPCLADAFSP